MILPSTPFYRIIAKLIDNHAFSLWHFLCFLMGSDHLQVISLKLGNLLIPSVIIFFTPFHMPPFPTLEELLSSGLYFIYVCVCACACVCVCVCVCVSNSFIKCLWRNAQVDAEQKWNFFQWRKKDPGSYIKCCLSYDCGSGEWLPLLETIIKSLQRKHYNKKYIFYLLTWQWYMYVAF